MSGKTSAVHRIVLILLGLAFGLELHAEKAQRPNIIVFLVDDYDKPETSVYGGKVLTPNLDRLAREGMTLHNAHVTSTVCTPSRYTFLTGRYAGSSTSRTYLDLFPEGKQGLPAFNVSLERDNMNVAKVLADAGYATGFVGKYHVGEGFDDPKRNGLHDLPKNVPFSREIDRQHFENEKRYRDLIKERGFTWAKNIYWNNTKAPFKGHNPEWTIAAALEFVEENKDQPFYLHYCTTLLHGPNGEWHNSLETKALMSGEGRLKKPVPGMPPRSSVMKRIVEAGLTTNEAGYLWMDDTLGLLLDKLDELKLAENTIVLFVSDHGSNKKGSLFRTRGTEIPCLIRWPKVIGGGVESDELVQNTDFVPTWFEVAGARAPNSYRIDGVSLLPLLKNPKQAVRTYVYGEQGPARSIKTEEWNYITFRYTTDQIEGLNGRRGARFSKTLLGLSGGISRSAFEHPYAFDADQLYHLKSDPEERSNVAVDRTHSRQLKKMREFLKLELERFDRPFGDFRPGGNASGRRDSLKVLEQLKDYHEDTDDPKRQKRRRKSGKTD